jgi:beta-glucosidase-like glycosyl hydrolase
MLLLPRNYRKRHDREMDPARLVFPGFTVGKQDPREAENLVRHGVGGFCLYRGAPRAIAALTARLRRLAKRPLLMCADYEEGAWAHVPGSTPLPTSLGVGASGSAAVAREKGRITGREARALGVDWVLAPVLDLLSEPKNPIVNLRAFSSDPKEAAGLAKAFLAGLRDAGALGCLKHFPGHGSTTEDSHLDLPTVNAPRALLAKRELAPFKALARGADAVMLGHLVVPALDPSKLPFTLSGRGPKMLRAWGFRGLIATDALDMGATRPSPAAAARPSAGSIARWRTCADRVRLSPLWAVPLTAAARRPCSRRASRGRAR